MRANAAWVKWCQTIGVLCTSNEPNTSKFKGLQNCHQTSCIIWSRAVGDNQETWTSLQCHGNADAQVVNWANKDWLRYKHQLMEDPLCCREKTQEKMQKSWLKCHVLLSSIDSVVKITLALSPEGKRPHRRPKKRWLDQIKEDMWAVIVTKEDHAKCRKTDPTTKWDNT